MEHLVLVVHVLVCVLLIGFILAQQGKGSEAGASFGSGASQTLFGSQGSGNFLTRATAILVTAFFAASLLLSYLATSRSKANDLDELLKKVQPSAAQTVQKEETNKQESHKAGNENQDIPAIPN